MTKFAHSTPTGNADSSRIVSEHINSPRHAQIAHNSLAPVPEGVPKGVKNSPRSSATAHDPSRSEGTRPEGTRPEGTVAGGGNTALGSPFGNARRELNKEKESVEAIPKTTTTDAAGHPAPSPTPAPKIVGNSALNKLNRWVVVVVGGGGGSVGGGWWVVVVGTRPWKNSQQVQRDRLVHGQMLVK